MYIINESLKARNTFPFQHFCFYEQLVFYAQLSWAWKKVCNLGPQVPEALKKITVSCVHNTFLACSNVYFVDLG